MEVIRYCASSEDTWDDFIQDCPMSTFLHSRRFLSYHGDRFDDYSLLFVNQDALLGVLPAAASAENAVESHPGATFGGIVHNGALAGDKMTEAINHAAAYYKKEGFSSFIYKPPSACYRRRPCDDDIYALCAAGASLTECKLSSVINLADRGEVSYARRKGRKKAEKAGLTMHCGADCISEIWNLVEDNLSLRHDTKPVHSLAEIEMLGRMFPDNIKFHVGRLEGEIVCCGVMFLSPTVWHAQYVHANETGRKICALDLFYEHLIAQATSEEVRYFSFGVSNRPRTEGGGLNAGLYAAKRQFGGGGEANWTFTLQLG